MNWKLILATCFFMLFSGALYAQGTPDGETPAHEGVCDVLIGQTPGLYGLCIAFCEAQDWDMYDPDDPQAAAKITSGLNILKNYNRKMRDGDFEMPCLEQPPDCPCFTYEEAEALFTSDRHDEFECWINDSESGLSVGVQSRDFSQVPQWRYAGRVFIGENNAVCRYWNYDVVPDEMRFSNEPEQRDEILYCADIILGLIDDYDTGECEISSP